MLLLLKVRVVSENIEPLDLEGDVLRDPRLKAQELLLTVRIPAPQRVTWLLLVPLV